MKILQIAPYFMPYIGGQESYVYNLSKQLVKNGHEVHIITSNYPKTKYHEELDGITIQRHDILVRPLRNPISLDFLKIKDIVNDYDVVHVHNGHSFPAMITGFLKSRKEFPLVITSHGKLKFGVSYKDFLVKIYRKTISKLLFDNCDKIIVLSKSQEDYISSFNPNAFDKIEIIPNAIDTNLFKEIDKLTPVNKTENLNLLYVGQLVKRKGLKWLIESISILKGKKIDNIKLILVGSGPDEAYFKKLVKDLKLNDLIEFKGQINDKKEVVSLYKNSDIFLLPSLSEGLPTVILEALFFGLPVIATDIPGIRDHFENYISLVPTKDNNKLAETIINLSQKDNLEQARKISKEFRNLIESKYSWSAVAEKYEIIYENILNKDQLFGKIPQDHQSEEILKINQSK